jgi:hypothetical protein
MRKDRDISIFKRDKFLWNRLEQASEYFKNSGFDEETLKFDLLENIKKVSKEFIEEKKNTAWYTVVV